tara:strand:- start:79 stop:480 length:402 start_codon:yes stop_codon:yes gene_type:complete
MPLFKNIKKNITQENKTVLEKLAKTQKQKQEQSTVTLASINKANTSRKPNISKKEEDVEKLLQSMKMIVQAKEEKKYPTPPTHTPGDSLGQQIERLRNKLNTGKGLTKRKRKDKRKTKAKKIKAKKTKARKTR